MARILPLDVTYIRMEATIAAHGVENYRVWFSETAQPTVAQVEQLDEVLRDLIHMIDRDGTGKAKLVYTTPEGTKRYIIEGGCVKPAYDPMTNPNGETI